MIRLEEIPPPEDADEIRELELARIRRDFIDRGTLPTHDDFGSLYCGRGERKPWRAKLLNGQHRKCAFCETKEQERYRTVEHLRPKARARRQNSEESSGYWWLAWSWSNLVFACQGCNSDKNCDYPLARTSRPLVAEQLPPGREVPLLIDPRQESAIEYIQFRHVPVAPFYWRPFPRDNSARGHWTIHHYGLARDELLSLYADWVRDTLTPIVADLRESLATQAPARIQQDWARLTRRWLYAPSQPFRGLTFDVLDQSFPPAIRQRYNLPLPPP